jgi:hypothetical protein
VVAAGRKVGPREGKWDRGKGSRTAGREVGPRDSHSGGADILAPSLPNLIAPLGECGQVLEIPRVDYVPNVGGHLAKEQDLLDLIH